MLIKIAVISLAIMNFITIYAMVRASKQRDRIESEILQNMPKAIIEKTPCYTYQNEHIERLTHISILNISPETGKWLMEEIKTKEPTLAVFRITNRFYMVNVPSAPELKEISEYIPKDMLSCIDFAIKTDCNWIIFDDNEPIVKELDNYSTEWTEEKRKEFF